jgi:hypothetical protein
VKGDPTDETAERDFRTPEQHHDGLLALVRSARNPELGTHRGLPVTVVATVQQLQERTGHAVTAGGSPLPIADLIRMAGHAHHPEPVRRARWPPSLPRPRQAHRHSGSANHVAALGSHMGWTCRVCDATFYWPPTDQVFCWLRAAVR